MHAILIVESFFEFSNLMKVHIYTSNHYLIAKLNMYTKKLFNLYSS